MTKAGDNVTTVDNDYRQVGYQQLGSFFVGASGWCGMKADDFRTSTLSLEE